MYAFWIENWWVFIPGLVYIETCVILLNDVGNSPLSNARPPNIQSHNCQTCSRWFNSGLIVSLGLRLCTQPSCSPQGLCKLRRGHCQPTKKKWGYRRSLKAGHIQRTNFRYLRWLLLEQKTYCMTRTWFNIVISIDV